MRTSFPRRLSLLAIVFFFVVPFAALAAERPNIILALADDLGYGDLGCYGNTITRTPNLDRFASQGMRFTDCYAAAPNCSPARTGLMTGRTPTRVGVHNWIPMFSPMHVPRDEVTIATLLRTGGYDTCHVGKWHLNGMFNLTGQPQPHDHGFSHWFSTQNNALPNHHDPANFVRNSKPVGQLEGYSAHLVVDEAIDWIEHRRDKEKPFFLFACFHEPHEPIATAPKYRELYPSEDASYSAYHGNVTQLDDALGRLFKALEDEDLANDTLVIFTSDNGPAITGRHPHGSTGPLQKKKGHVYEGGIRVPGIVRWPGRIEPGTVSEEPVCGVDVLPTLCAVTGTEPPRDRAIDGTDLTPLFEGEPIERSTPLYWHFWRAKSSPKVALREGDWKVLARLSTGDLKPSGGITEEDIEALTKAKPMGFELYNLREDIAEEHDLAADEPERLRELAAKLTAMYADVTQDSPVWPVWEWPRYESELIEWTPQSRGGHRPAKKKVGDR
ncbi:Arylsulfatase [Planctomycetes bacterium Pan216]|uniref:Arylsulfatase n=1 Tax=Kolteria novifilia TaxID=2527975 RepID=A0A518B086_9BACT|nr:Arylsulfatase [Planctomycetes bacterium Pan216]